MAGGGRPAAHRLTLRTAKLASARLKLGCPGEGANKLARRYNLFIDGQNMPVEYVNSIMEYCSAIGIRQEHARLYASPEEVARIVAKNGPLLADYDIDTVSVPCKPRKNSVDIRIAVDVIEEAVEDTDSDVVIVATNDSDFTHVASRVISYRSEFHLLYTGTAPTGYSSRVIMSQLAGPPSRRQKIVSQVKKVASIFAAPKKAAAIRPPTAFAVDPDYAHATPLASLSEAGFIMRIMAASPAAIDSRALFQAWKDYSGRAWKGKASKKTAQQFADEHFPPGAYRFLEWSETSQNVGYFLSADYGALIAPNGFRNPAFSLVGVHPELLAAQCALLATAMAGASYDNFNLLYDPFADRNVLPRYGAWAIVAAYIRHAKVAEQPRWADPIERQPSIDAQTLRRSFEAELRRQFEEGEIGLEPALRATEAG